MLNIFKKEKIEITEFDSRRLGILIVTASNPKSKINGWLNRLRLLLDRAKLVSSEEIKSDRVTMNSKIKLQDKISQEEVIVTLVFPVTAIKELKLDFEESKVSILSPIGLSILGRQVGDNIRGRIIISEMLYQPETEGDYYL